MISKAVLDPEQDEPFDNLNEAVRRINASNIIGRKQAENFTRLNSNIFQFKEIVRDSYVNEHEDLVDARPI